MTALEGLRIRYTEFINELKLVVTTDLKDKDPELYYKMLGILNKYDAKSPYEPDNDNL